MVAWPHADSTGQGLKDMGSIPGSAFGLAVHLGQIVLLDAYSLSKVL